jgi:hypothetical protein
MIRDVLIREQSIWTHFQRHVGGLLYVQWFEVRDDQGLTLTVVRSPGTNKNRIWTSKRLAILVRSDKWKKLADSLGFTALHSPFGTEVRFLTFFYTGYVMLANCVTVESNPVHDGKCEVIAFVIPLRRKSSSVVNFEMKIKIWSRSWCIVNL